MFQSALAPGQASEIVLDILAKREGKRKSEITYKGLSKDQRSLLP
jgi:hypothetical protein